MKRAIVLLTICICFLTSFAQTFKNPLRNFGPDPFMVFFQGNYYLTYSSSPTKYLNGNGIEIIKVKSLADVQDAEPTLIWKEENEMRNSYMWAPELHRLNTTNGYRWYLYYTAGPSSCCEGQRVHVLESENDDPIGPYAYKAQLTSEYGIDGSVLQVNDDLYFLYAQANEGNHIHIMKMLNPYTVVQPSVRIASAKYSWEKVAGLINEAPVALVRGNKIFLTYSYNDCNSEFYGLGLLTANANGNLLDPSSWEKKSAPVLQLNAAKKVFAPGHNAFFKSPDGTEDWIVYHANSAATDACGEKRTPRVQKIGWNRDGSPNFGSVVSATQNIKLPAGDPKAGDAISSASIVGDNSSVVDVYPTSSTDIIKIEYTSAVDESVSVILKSPTGMVLQKIFEGDVEAAVTHVELFNVQTFAAGLYFISLDSPALRQTFKIFVKH
jgi:GH43 family beta-xylosidase